MRVPVNTLPPRVLWKLGNCNSPGARLMYSATISAKGPRTCGPVMRCHICTSGMCFRTMAWQSSMAATTSFLMMAIPLFSGRLFHTQRAVESFSFASDRNTASCRKMDVAGRLAVGSGSGKGCRPMSRTASRNTLRTPILSYTPVRACSTGLTTSFFIFELGISSGNGVASSSGSADSVLAFFACVVSEDGLCFNSSTTACAMACATEADADAEALLRGLVVKRACTLRACGSSRLPPFTSMSSGSLPIF